MHYFLKTKICISKMIMYTSVWDWWAFKALTAGDNPLQVDDVRVIELCHDAGLAEEIPPLFLSVAGFKSLQSHWDITFPGQLHPPITHFPKLSWCVPEKKILVSTHQGFDMTSECFVINTKIMCTRTVLLIRCLDKINMYFFNEIKDNKNSTIFYLGLPWWSSITYYT